MKTVNYRLLKKDIKVFQKYINSYEIKELKKLSIEFKNFFKRTFSLDLHTRDEVLLESNLLATREVLYSLLDSDTVEFDSCKLRDIYLTRDSNLATYMMSKIIKFLRSEMNKYSRHILYGDHKEKWGGIVGHVDVNNEIIARRIVNFVKSIRKMYPFISSSYTIRTIGFELNKHQLEGLNDYRSIHKYKWQVKRYWKGKYNKRKKTGYSGFINNYKSKTRENRRKIIRHKIRLSWRDNLK